jgi:uncharacterized membrane protein
MSDAVQMDLLSWHPAPLSRRRDPKTSHAAARSIADDLPRLLAIVLKAIEDEGPRGATLDDIMRATGLEKVTASPRCRPLADMGLIVDSGRTRIGSAGRAQIVWLRNRST